MDKDTKVDSNSGSIEHANGKDSESVEVLDSFLSMHEHTLSGVSVAVASAYKTISLLVKDGKECYRLLKEFPAGSVFKNKDVDYKVIVEIGHRS